MGRFVAGSGRPGLGFRGAYQSLEPRPSGARRLRPLLQPGLSRSHRALRALSCGPSWRSAGNGVPAGRCAVSGTLPARLARHHLLCQRRLSHRTPRYPGGPKTRDRILAWPTRPCAKPIGGWAKTPTTWTRFMRGAGRAPSSAPTLLWSNGAMAAGSGWPPGQGRHVRVLQLDPDYVDAKLVVGVYEYVVGALPCPSSF